VRGLGPVLVVRHRAGQLRTGSRRSAYRRRTRSGTHPASAGHGHRRARWIVLDPVAIRRSQGVGFAALRSGCLDTSRGCWPPRPTGCALPRPWRSHRAWPAEVIACARCPRHGASSGGEAGPRSLGTSSLSGPTRTGRGSSS
jgi:hypothetical protein